MSPRNSGGPEAAPSAHEPPSGPVVARSLLRHQVVDILRHQLTNGVLAPGQHLLEQNLANALQISRGPVREALLQLETEGLILSDPHRGFQVIRPNLAYVVELYEFRAMLEGFAADAAAKVGDAELIVDLQSLIGEMERHAADGHLGEMLQRDMQFHQRIVEASGHQRVLRSWLQVKSQVILVVHLTSPAIQEDLRDPRALHEGIVMALADRDADAARAAATDHVLRVPAVLAERMGSDWESLTEVSSEWA